MTTKGRKLQWKTVRKRGTFRHRARGKEHGARSTGQGAWGKEHGAL